MKSDSDGPEEPYTQYSSDIINYLCVAFSGQRVVFSLVLICVRFVSRDFYMNVNRAAKLTIDDYGDARSVHVSVFIGY